MEDIPTRPNRRGKRHQTKVIKYQLPPSDSAPEIEGSGSPPNEEQCQTKDKEQGNNVLMNIHNDNINEPFSNVTSASGDTSGEMESNIDFLPEDTSAVAQGIIENIKTEEPGANVFADHCPNKAINVEDAAKVLPSSSEEPEQESLVDTCFHSISMFCCGYGWNARSGDGL